MPRLKRATSFIAVTVGSSLSCTCSVMQDARATLAERRVDPASLQGKHKRRRDKEERMASVLEGALSFRQA